MTKILLVGVVPYGYKEKLVEKYPNIIWFEACDIGMSENAFALVELVKMMDGVMFMNEYKRDRLPYEILCTLDNKKMYDKWDYPIDDAKEKK